MKLVSIILFLVAALGSRDMLVSSQNEEHHSPAYEVKNAAGQEGNLRGGSLVRALDSSSDDGDLISSSNSTDSDDSSDSNSSDASVSSNSNSRKK
jgi:hypothetical protein